MALLLTAAFTILSNPNVATLRSTNIAGYLVPVPISLSHFGLTLNALLVFVVLLACAARWPSPRGGRTPSDVGLGARSFGILLVALLVVGFLELQPLLLDG